MKYKFTFLIAVIALAWMLPGQITSQKAEFKAPIIINVAKAAAPLRPAYLTIPNAKVSANIIEVGITTDGKLDVPNNYVEVGWYKYGPKPGEMGSAVLDAHVDNGGFAPKIPGPFKHLRNLKIGDKIYVTMNDGTVLKYNVTVSEVHDTNKFPGEKVFHQKGDRYLKLITCHGKFVPKMGTYDQRLIITAVLEA